MRPSILDERYKKLQQLQQMKNPYQTFWDANPGRDSATRQDLWQFMNPGKSADGLVFTQDMINNPNRQMSDQRNQMWSPGGAPNLPDSSSNTPEQLMPSPAVPKKVDAAFDLYRSPEKTTLPPKQTPSNLNWSDLYDRVKGGAAYNPGMSGKGGGGMMRKPRPNQMIAF